MNLSISSSNIKRIKRFLFLSILLLFFIFLLDRLLFFSFLKLEMILYNQNFFEKNFKIEFSENKYDTLLFGTSRTYEGIHPVFLQKTLGISVLKDASVGKGPKNFYYFYKLYKKNFGIPKTIIYGIDYFIFSVKSTTKNISRFQDANINDNKIGMFSEFLFLLKNKHKISVLINNYLLNFDKKKPDNPINDLKKIQSYTGGPHTPDKMISDKPNTKPRRQWFPRPPGKEGKFLFKLLDELQKDKVTVILILLPDYYGTYKTNFQQKKFIKFFKRLVSKYNNTFVYNFNRKSMFPLDEKKYFLDGGWGKTNCHLSDEGAKFFNKILCSKIRRHF